MKTQKKEKQGQELKLFQKNKNIGMLKNKHPILKNKIVEVNNEKYKIRNRI